MSFGAAGFGTTPYGGGPTYRLLRAHAPNNRNVIATFNEPRGFNAFNPTHYSIPGLEIERIVFDPDSVNAVRIITSSQLYQNYTLTVSTTLQSSLGSQVNSSFNVAGFTGYPLVPHFAIAPMTARRLAVTFAEPMLNDTALTAVINYALVDASGGILAIDGVTAIGDGLGIRKIHIDLIDPIVPHFPYALTLSTDISTLGGLELKPNTVTFTWVIPSLRTKLSLGKFNGERKGGLFGNPDGQVFFSPSLEGIHPNSAISVDEVSVCTTAYDKYKFPEFIDPNPLYTYKPGSPVPALGTTVLFAKPHRLAEARFEMAARYTETVAPPTEVSCEAVLTEVLDKSFVSYLNNPYWRLNGSGGAVFQATNNLAPIPPGPVVPISLPV